MFRRRLFLTVVTGVPRRQGDNQTLGVAVKARPKVVSNQFNMPIGLEGVTTVQGHEDLGGERIEVAAQQGVNSEMVEPHQLVFPSFRRAE